MQCVVVSFNIMHSFVWAVTLCKHESLWCITAVHASWPWLMTQWLIHGCKWEKRSAVMEFYPSPSPCFRPPYCQLKIMLPVAALLEMFLGSKILSKWGSLLLALIIISITYYIAAFTFIVIVLRIGRATCQLAIAQRRSSSIVSTIY